MRVAVIGAGISGLAIARELGARGIDVRVFEADARAGGKIRSEALGGWLVEWGPGTFADDGPTLTLSRALGLEGALVLASESAKTRYLALGGALRAVPASPPALMKSDLLTVSARLRVLAEPFVRRGRDEDETVASFFRRRFGRVIAERFAGAFVSGVYAGDAERLSVRASFPRLHAVEREYGSILRGARRAGLKPAPMRSFRGGLQTLTDALATSLGDALQRGVALRGLARPPGTTPGGHPPRTSMVEDPTHPAGARWRLRLDDGRAASEAEADAVVLAVPAHAAAPLVSPIDAAAGEALAAIPYAPVGVVHLGWPEGDLPRPAHGFGFLAPPDERLGVLGTIFASSLFEGRAPDGHVLLTSMIGGARRPELAALADDELGEIARHDLGKLLGVISLPTFARVVRHERAIPQYVVGHLARVAATEAAEARHRGLFFGGNAYRGVGLSDCVREAANVAARVAGGAT